MLKPVQTLLMCATALTAFALPQAAWAQDPPAAEEAPTNEKPIIVTARRRDESIVDVPLAITVVNDQKMEQLGLTSTADIANFVPSLEFSDFTQGNSRNDRGGNRTIIFRGLNLANNGGSVTQAASMFLDGAAVIGNEIPGGMDIGAVEVLRGPQNVYFGRATMTGAIAYRTKPIPNELGVEAALEVAERETFRVEASISGPIVADVLGFRVTGLYETNDGYVTNLYDPSGPRLGSRSRRSMSATLDLTPAESIEIKGYVNYFEDEDGPSATANVFPDALYTGTATAPGTVVALGTVTNCLVGRDATLNGITTRARATICGKVPSRRRALPYSRTDIPADHANVLFGLTPFIRAEGFKRQAGMQRHAFNSHVVANLNISDYLKLQSITGYHVNTTIQMIDGAAQPIRPTSAFSVLTFGLTSKFKDFSQELRLSSDPEMPFSWTVGANYINAKVLSQAFNITTTNIQPTAAVPNPGQTTNGVAGAFNVAENSSKTYGFFAGAYLKLLDDRLTLSGEARYQIDDRFTQSLFPATLAVVTTSPILDKKFKAFYPRASVDFDVGGGRKVYASLAKGGRPGGFNAGLLSFLDPNNARYATCGCFTQAVAQITALFGVTTPDFKQESLAISEFGFKGYLDDGKGYFDINAYYGVLKNQQVTQAQVITALIPPTTLSIITNTGASEIYGIEFTGNYRFTPEISLDTTFSWNEARRTTYIDNAPGNIAIYGITDYSGLRLHLVPWITGSAVLSYEPDVSDDWAPFGNLALVYRGKQYADIGNLSYIPGRVTADLRLGAKNGQFRLEAFVTNLTDNRTYPAGNVAADFGINQVNGIRSQYSGFFAAFAEPRTFGLRATGSF